jgi:hypothetical protein
LASQLPEDYSQAERARTYIANLKPAIKHHLPLYQILCTFKDALEMALRIENNAELLGAETALAKAMSRRSQGDCSRSTSRRKREASPSQDDRDRNDDHDRQESGDHRQKRKGKSRARFEERIQPGRPSYPYGRRTSDDVPAVLRQADYHVALRSTS